MICLRCDGEGCEATSRAFVAVDLGSNRTLRSLLRDEGWASNAIGNDFCPACTRMRRAERSAIDHHGGMPHAR